ncbi:MAG TPA: TIM-barrel domain-containing protein [Cytophagales bacterium]|nr:TIM-barrel domain-containing protein [Cytophagales bacterium]
MKRFTLYLILFIAFSCDKKEKYEKLKDGIIVHFENKNNETEQIHLQVISDRIIHVRATPSDSFSFRPSLMVIEQEQKIADWSVKEEDNTIILQTDFIKAKVSAITGEVIFTDLNDNLFVEELKGGGKKFHPLKIENENGYQIVQVFESPKDEAFYGLGQHQNDVINYKGKDVELIQFNTEVAVPFVVSNKNYGILWDNYSITRFGDSREFKQLSGLKLYSKEGEEGGLTAIYFDKKDPKQIYITKKENSIDYEFLDDLSKFPKEFPLADGKVTWEGTLASDLSGNHKFLMTHGGYIKVWLNGYLIIDKWRQCWNPSSSRFELAMEKGKKYPVKIEWIPDGGESYLSLKYLEPLPDGMQDKLCFSSEVADQIDYYFVAGKNADDVISGYRTLTGKAPIMPKWAMGLWQSRERYKTQEEVLSVVEEFRKRKVPLDNIVQDWFYWEKDKWGSQKFDKSRFPDPEGMINTLHEKYNTQFMISVWPKFYEGIENYKTFNQKGWLYPRNIENNQKDWIGYVSTFYDAYDPKARNAFWDLLNSSLYKKGVDAWWLDATEPDILSNSSLEQRRLLQGPTALGSSSRYFNAFPIVNAKGIYEGQREEDPNKRVFILTRSAFGGLQRYSAATWSGDIGSRWHDMKAQIPAGINFSLSGIPYWTMDIGGFATETRYSNNPKGEDLEEWRELNTRWFQFGAFCPLFRVHGQYPYREFYNIAPEGHFAYKSMVYYDKLRYRLMPYIYSLAGSAFHEDNTIMRGLMMDFPQDEKALNIGDQYMFGPSFLVNPVYDYKARHRKVYLPQSGGWYDLYSGVFYTGQQEINAEAPVERMPVFVKAGSIIPFGPELQYAMEKPADSITLYVYAGANGSFKLYEDENVNYNYEKGKFSIIPFSYDEENSTLEIGAQKGSFPGELKERNINIVFVQKDNSVPLDFNYPKGKQVKYTGKPVSVKL